MTALYYRFISVKIQKIPNSLALNHTMTLMGTLTHLVSSADDNLGRVSKSTLSQQMLMELVVQYIESREKIGSFDSGSVEISEWNGVILNDRREVSRINWFRYGLHGSLSLEWLPHSVQNLWISNNNLTGSLDLTFGDGLREARVSSNKLKGTVAFDCLPEHLEIFEAHNNTLTGGMRLTALPQNMKQLTVEINKFEGTVALTRLPRTLILLNIAYNRLCGEIDFTHLPPTLVKLYVHDNMFDGEANFSHLPASLLGFDLSNTKISGVIYMEPSQRYSMQNLNGKMFATSQSGVKVIAKECCTN